MSVIRGLCVAAVCATGVVTLGAVLAAGYTHGGTSPLPPVGAAAQLAIAVSGLLAAVVALDSLDDNQRRSRRLLPVAFVAAVVWWPVLMAFWG